ncbi:MAG: hypothetical protein Q7J06_11120 [Bacteroidales bacterium]|nr:hypothetical protein [Bacteroidales bacterium]
MKNIKTYFFFAFLFIFLGSYSQQNADSSKIKLKANATVSINSNGIATIPAFSLDKPAIMASIALVKNRFSYEPLLAYGLDLKPWFIDNWLHYVLVRKPAFQLRTGFNISSFFSEYKVIDEAFLQGQRYFAFELTGVYKPSPNNSLTLAYWNDRGQEQGTIKGHFISLIGERSGINIGKQVLLSAALQIFYINYDGNNDGLFLSPKISSSVRNVPFSLYFQATQTLDTIISPFPGFRWNLGLSYTL